MWTLTRKDSWKATVRFCIVLGAASAVVTATLGWCDAAVSHYRGSTAGILMWHRWFGTATAAVGGSRRRGFGVRESKGKSRPLVPLIFV